MATLPDLRACSAATASSAAGDLHAAAISPSATAYASCQAQTRLRQITRRAFVSVMQNHSKQTPRSASCEWPLRLQHTVSTNSRQTTSSSLPPLGLLSCNTHLNGAVRLIQAIHADAGSLVKCIARIRPQPCAANLADRAVDARCCTPVRGLGLQFSVVHTQVCVRLDCMACCHCRCRNKLADCARGVVADVTLLDGLAET